MFVLGINPDEFTYNSIDRNGNILVDFIFHVDHYDLSRLVRYVRREMTGGESRQLEKEFEVSSIKSKDKLYEYLDSLQNFVQSELEKDQCRKVLIKLPNYDESLCHYSFKFPVSLRGLNSKTVIAYARKKLTGGEAREFEKELEQIAEISKEKLYEKLLQIQDKVENILGMDPDANIVLFFPLRDQD